MRGEQFVSGVSSLATTLYLQVGSGLSATWDLFRDDRLGRIGLYILVFFVFLGVFGSYVAPHNPDTMHRGEDGSILRYEPPSSDHLLGTTKLGRDVLSQVIIGTRVTLIAGFLGAFMSVFIGTNIGLLSGYIGGWTDDVLMRLTDIAYGLPFIPFIIILVALLGASLTNIILAIALVLWRSTARVIRSQVLSHKERPYIESAKASGASNPRIMYLHILPNVLPLTFLYATFAVGYAVLAEASVAFLGFGDPNLYSWGKMMFEVYYNGAIRFAWWWIIPPGIMIMLFVMSVFFIGRTLEELANPELKHRE